MRSDSFTRIRNVTVGTLAALAVGVTLVACTPPSVDPDEELTLTLGVATAQLGVAAGWDPLQGGVPDGYLYLAVYDNLIHWDFDTYTSTPGLAKEFTFGDDRKSLDLTLRDDVDFTDGTHLDAEGVAKYFNAMIASPSWIYGGAILPYDPVFEATGEYTLTVTTSKPIYDQEFMWILMSAMPVLSPTALDDPESAAATPIGSGPYLIEEIVPDVETVLVRNPDYWDADSYPYDRIVLKGYDDEIAKMNALKSGQIDATQLTSPYAAEAESAGLIIHDGGGVYTALVVWDPVNSTEPALRDVRVREAIMLAFDRDQIVDSLLLGYGQPVTQVLAEGQPGFVENAGDRYDFDLDRARELMAEAGYADGFDITIPIIDPAAAADWKPIVEQSLGDLGIRVTFKDFADVVEGLKAAWSGEYPLTFAQQPYYNSFRLLTEKFEGLGTPFNASQEIIDLVAIIKGSDPEASAQAATELGQLLFDDLWWLPIATQATLWASTTSVDVDLNTLDGGILSLAAFTPTE